jgi:hypothetical protein
MIDLERKIAAALDSASAGELAALIAETEAAIVTATENAKLERALDPLLSPDAKAARAAMEDAQFLVGRLQTLLPRLQQRCEAAQRAEYWAEWRADYEALKVKRDALAAEFRGVYPRAVAEIVSLFARIAANDEELSQLHRARPAGVPLHLRNAEQEARNLDAFTRDTPSVTKELKLPDWERSNKLAWPLPRPHNIPTVAPVAYDRRYSGDWWRDGEERAAAAQADQERIA